MKASDFFTSYGKRVSQHIQAMDWEKITPLAESILECHKNNRQVFLCGNGGSAANAMHIVNDLIYGTSPLDGRGLRAEALCANTAVVTCLANDIGYDDIYAQQLAVKGQQDDLLIVLSGSGNSPNVINALKMAKKQGIKTAALLGYSGGACKKLAEIVIHFKVDDMQIAEDLQMMVGHMITQWMATMQRQQFESKRAAELGLAIG